MEKAPSVEQTPESILAKRPGTSTNTAQPAPSLMMHAPSIPVDTRSPEEVEQDMALEYDSMVLLSHLEQLAMRLSDNIMQASAALALEYVVNLANHLIGFTEQLPLSLSSNFTLETLIVRDRQHYAHLGLKYVRDGRLDMAAFEELHIKQGAIRHPNTFQQLSKDVLRVINICLNICIKAFHSPMLRQQWRTVYSGFLVNLAKSLQTFQTPQRDR
jgi:hypothetical protein